MFSPPTTSYAKALTYTRVISHFLFSVMTTEVADMTIECVALLDVKPGSEPQAKHQNKMRMVFLRRFPLSSLPWKVSQNTYRSESISNCSFCHLWHFFWVCVLISVTLSIASLFSTSSTIISIVGMVVETVLSILNFVNFL